MSNEIVPYTPVVVPQSKKSNDGLIAVVAFLGIFATLMLWSMSAGSSFFGLDAAASLPSQADIAAEDVHRVPATGPMELGNIDAEAVIPVAEAPRGAPRTAVPGSTGVADEADFAVASLQTSLLGPASLRDSEAGADGMRIPYFALETPAQPRIAATEDTEQALGLRYAARVAVQRRLALDGFDPKGSDGVFGPNTRNAITNFQIARGFPATGFLEPAVYDHLKQRTEEAYQARSWQRVAARSAVPVPAPATEPETTNTIGADGCARHPDGRIIARQSFACDVAGLSQGFAGPSRNGLAYGEGAGTDR